MLKQLKNKLYVLKFQYKNNHLKWEGLKICFLYFMIGFIWVYFSDRTVAYLFKDKQTMLIINTYKGIFYVLLTALFLYYLIAKLLKKGGLHGK
jgi:hypothetical protein